jgi:hypothetical protein
MFHSLRCPAGALLPALLFSLLSISAPAHSELRAELKPELREIDWLELMPAADLALLENMAELEHEGDGPTLLPDEIMTGRVVPEMGNVEGRIPGFVVPLKTTQDMRILEFFLVPYYGACIHVPPPPPNQIIHIKYKPGFTLEALYDPVWVEGTLVIDRTETDLGTSSYSMVAGSVEPYEE